MRPTSSTWRMALAVWIGAGCGSPSSLDARAPDPSRPPAAPIPSASAWPALVIDEVLPGNDSVSTDEALDFDDWVELYNPTPAAVSLAGWGLADDLGKPDWTFPADAVIGPGEHLIVWLDDEVDEGPLHASIRIAGDGDELALFAPDGTIVDAITWLAHPDDVVLGRFPSGGPFWAPSIRATPGNPNPLDPGRSLDPSDALFPSDEVIRLDLYVEAEEWAALRADNYASVRGSVGFEGAFLRDVQLRIKGGWGSRRSADQKAGLKIDLDEHVAGQRLRGLENLTLNNMVQDVSGVHELLGYQLMRDAGIPAPRVAHVELWLNGAYRGLYLNVETVDDQWLERWFADPDGNLYEGAYGQDVTRTYAGELPLDEQGAADPADRSELWALADFLAQPPSELLWPEFEQRIDVDGTLGSFAAEVLLGHWDGYFYYPNNWRIYHEPTLDRWTVLVWGIDQTFASDTDPYGPNGALATWCLQMPSCRVRYDLALWDVAERMLDLDCRTRVEAALARIEPLYAADPLREGTVADMRASAEATIAYCESRPHEILDALFPAGVP